MIPRDCPLRGSRGWTRNGQKWTRIRGFCPLSCRADPVSSPPAAVTSCWPATAAGTQWLPPTDQSVAASPCQSQPIASSTAVLAIRGDGGVGLFRRLRPAELERRHGLYDLPALHLWRRPALPHDGGLQPQAEAAAARAAPKEVLQALGTFLRQFSGRFPQLRELLEFNNEYVKLSG